MNEVANKVNPADPPPLCRAGHVLVVSSALFRASTGSAVVMRNLLSQFDPATFTVLTYEVAAEHSARISSDWRVVKLRVRPPFTHRGERYWKDLIRPFVRAKVRRLISRLSPAAVLAVYPDLHMFSAASEAVQCQRTPWLAYLHDTLAEPYAGTKYERWANSVQQQMFASADGIFVTGRGMAEFFKSKYAIATKTLEIPLCEAIRNDLPDHPVGPAAAFMGGSVYGVNDKGIARLITAAKQCHLEFRLASVANWNALASSGIQRGSVELLRYGDRREYLAALLQQSVLTVTLNWPEESNTPKDELATAFPTKAVEYLASGRPILVHCPEDYFLARFFRENDCGIVVSSRDTSSMEGAYKKILTGGPEIDRMRRNALQAARLFSIERLRKVLQDEMDAITQRRHAATENAGVPTP